MRDRPDPEPSQAPAYGAVTIRYTEAGASGLVMVKWGISRFRDSFGIYLAQREFIGLRDHGYPEAVDSLLRLFVAGGAYRERREPRHNWLKHHGKVSLSWRRSRQE